MASDAAVPSEIELPPPDHESRENAKTRTVENELVADHYNTRGNQTFKRRRESPIIELRKVQNWLKSVLILGHARRGDFALDIAGGKGGDLNKWERAEIEHLVLADVAEKSVQDALERYNDSLKKGGRQQMRFSAHWIAVDCCQPSLQRELDRVDFFDIVSCQFSIHYAFESTERTRTFISNVAFKLRPGGLFIGTTPHAETLLRHSQASADLRSFKNDICSFVFDRPMEKIENGQRYIFTLTDAIADVAEYVVDPKVFTDICAEFDLELVSMENLQQVYEREIRSRRFGKLADEQHIPLKSKNLKPETWETFGLYMAYVFRKKGTPDSTKHRVRFDLKRAELTDIAKP